MILINRYYHSENFFTDVKVRYYLSTDMYHYITSRVHNPYKVMIKVKVLLLIVKSNLIVSIS